MSLVLPLGSIASTYRETVVDNGDQPLLLMLVAFGLTFGLTRFITHSIRANRFKWLGNVEAGDTHIHHLVWGIILLLVSGFLAIVVQPALEVTAIVFGIGAALTLDEFALWLHLDDVYWSEQGRQSIDAVIVFAVVSGFMLIGVYPISIEPDRIVHGHHRRDHHPGVHAALGRDLSSKGKLMWAVFGFYIPFVAIIGSARLARPESWWARNRYDDKKLARSALATRTRRRSTSRRRPDAPGAGRVAPRAQGSDRRAGGDAPLLRSGVGRRLGLGRRLRRQQRRDHDRADRADPGRDEAAGRETVVEAGRRDRPQRLAGGAAEAVGDRERGADRVRGLLGREAGRRAVEAGRVERGEDRADRPRRRACRRARGSCR